MTQTRKYPGVTLATLLVIFSTNAWAGAHGAEQQNDIDFFREVEVQEREERLRVEVVHVCEDRRGVVGLVAENGIAPQRLAPARLEKGGDTVSAWFLDSTGDA